MNASAAKSDAPTEPAPLEIDTNKLFDFAGMSTNRTEMPANPFGAEGIKEPSVNASADAPSATPSNPFGDDIFAAPANQPAAAAPEENKQDNDLANFL